MDPRSFSFEETTRDGAPIYIRAIRPDDQQRLSEFHRRLSPESVYFRFFEIKQELSPKDLRYLTELDFDRRVALVATLAPAPDAPLVGVARYDVLPETGLVKKGRAELGIVVEDAHQGRGIGTQLLKHLLGIAYSQGVREITAEVLPQNTKMLELVSSSGVPVRRRLEEGMIQLRL
ncbi:MAG TPA: GNAT family N-acetyltransferase [Gemmatimonadales bacterium]|nr:GNAT family N-acetyltransferase [Gemmatimonadales bacterium]